MHRSKKWLTLKVLVKVPPRHSRASIDRRIQKNRLASSGDVHGWMRCSTSHDPSCRRVREMESETFFNKSPDGEESLLLEVNMPYTGTSTDMILRLRVKAYLNAVNRMLLILVDVINFDWSVPLINPQVGASRAKKPHRHKLKFKAPNTFKSKLFRSLVWCI
jgi:hypothetical protein